MNFLDIKAGEPIASGQRPPRTRKVSNSRRSAKLRAIDMAVKSKPIARLLASGMSIPNSLGNTMAVGSDRKAIADCDIHQRFGERCFASLFAPCPPRGEHPRQSSRRRPLSTCLEIVIAANCSLDRPRMPTRNEAVLMMTCLYLREGLRRTLLELVQAKGDEGLNWLRDFEDELVRDTRKAVAWMVSRSRTKLP
jgi:hypothetical protein